MLHADGWAFVCLLYPVLPHTRRQLPTNLLSSARVFVYEPASGLKASLVRALHSTPEQTMAQEPLERGRVHLRWCGHLRRALKALDSFLNGLQL